VEKFLRPLLSACAIDLKVVTNRAVDQLAIKVRDSAAIEECILFPLRASCVSNDACGGHSQKKVPRLMLLSTTAEEFLEWLIPAAKQKTRSKKKNTVTAAAAALWGRDVLLAGCQSVAGLMLHSKSNLTPLIVSDWLESADSFRSWEISEHWDLNLRCV
jgi:hypothetical protein